MLSQVIHRIALIYRWSISPALHLIFGPSYGCRFVPTCSQYADEALQIHGSLKGLFLTLKRLSRCHPFARAGYDPVPHAIAQSIEKVR